MSHFPIVTNQFPHFIMKECNKEFRPLAGTISKIMPTYHPTSTEHTRDNTSKKDCFDKTFELFRSGNNSEF